MRHLPRWRHLFWLIAGLILLAIAPATAERSVLDLQILVDAADAGDTITLTTGELYTGAVIDKADLTIDVNGATIAPAANGSALTLTAANATIDCATGGRIDGTSVGRTTHGLGDGITIVAGADNPIIERCEIRHWANGVLVSADIISLKLIANFIHTNAADGLHIARDVALTGVITVEGNLFKANGGNGIHHDGGTLLEARRNSWGHIDGATAGDGAGGDGPLDVTEATFAELFFAPDPTDTSVEKRNVDPGAIFDTQVMVDAAGLFAVTFYLTYDAALIQLQDIAPAQFTADSGLCLFTTSIPGEASGICYRFFPAPTITGPEVSVATLTFEAIGQGITTIDVLTGPADLTAGAPGGVNVYVNNGGLGAPFGNGLRIITDTDDGRIAIGQPTAARGVTFSAHETREAWQLLAGVSLALAATGAGWWVAERRKRAQT